MLRLVFRHTYLDTEADQQVFHFRFERIVRLAQRLEVRFGLGGGLLCLARDNNLLVTVGTSLSRLIERCRIGTGMRHEKARYGTRFRDMRADNRRGNTHTRTHMSAHNSGSLASGAAEMLL